MSETSPPQPGAIGNIAAVWGIVGVCMLLLSALLRLAPVAWDALTGPLTGGQWAFTVGFAVFMAYGEGYRGFQKAFSPRVIARARWLRHRPSPARVLLAPMFCMGLFHATAKRMKVSWSITSMVVLLIVSVGQLPAPWRGLVDAGVVLGLTWGLLAILGWGVWTLRGGPLPVPPDVPDNASLKTGLATVD